MKYTIKFDAPGLAVSIETDHHHNVLAFTELMFGSPSDEVAAAEPVATAEKAEQGVTLPETKVPTPRTRSKKGVDAAPAAPASEFVVPDRPPHIAAAHAAAAHAAAAAAAPAAPVAPAAPAAPAAPTAAAAAAAAAPAAAPAAPAASAVSRDELTHRFFCLASADMAKAQELIAGHGVKKFSLLPEEKLAEVDAQLKGLGF